MGIPGLYPWLVERYPNTICCVAEERQRFSHGPAIKTTKRNPNGVEFDNLYIDMNGLIHPCFHPEGLRAPESYEVVFKVIFRYIDRVFSIVRPRKLLYLAVDGVAPRAKMNHQRVRRFRAAREAAGQVRFGKSEGDKNLDSNVITPGTEFMDLLSSALQYYVHLRMNSDPGWINIKVILSDSTVVGEGEHKILSYIRSQRILPGYDPNTRHCFHGLDADLIMLALATHEIHISILREVITYGKHRKSGSKTTYSCSMEIYLDHLRFEFFNIWVLREYLEGELLPNVEGRDFERLIDDFVLICLFVGNDFLPHLPSLEVAKGGIELLLVVYQEEFAKMGYLTDSSKVDLKSMEHFLQALSSHEIAISMKCAQEERKRKRSGFQNSAYDIEIHNKYTKPLYYTRNFDCESHDINRIKTDAVLRYTEGVCWIMHYYYQGVCSWQWFYPYHYAPFASDFCGLDKLEIHFTLGQPLKPLDQLLGVLPAARELMTNESSPILDLYPKAFKIDRNGKKHLWQGVCKLPFIEESRILSETVKVEHTLRAEEKQRNKFGRDRLFVHGVRHPLGRLIEEHHQDDPSLELKIRINPKLSRGMNGYLCISGKPVCPLRIPSPVVGGKNINKNLVKSVDYKCPSYGPQVPKLLSGVKMPPKILRSQDSPPPLFIRHATSSLSQPISSASPTEESRKKKRKGDKGEKLGGASEPEMQDDCIEANTLATKQHGSKDGGCCDEKLVGKSEAQVYLVEDSVGEKLRDMADLSLSSNQQQHILVGMQRVAEGDYGSGRDENLNSGVCEERTKGIASGLASSISISIEGLEVSGKPKKRKRKQVVREVGEKDEVNIQVHEKPENTEEQGEGNMASVEKPTNRKKHKKRRVLKVEVQLVEGEDKTNGSVEGEHKEQEKMIAPQVHLIDKTGGGVSGEKETRNKMESHEILDSKVALVEEGLMSQKVNVEVIPNKMMVTANGQEEMESGGDKMKKQKNSKSAIGVGEKSNGFEVGEITNKKPYIKEQEIVDMVGLLE